MSKQDRTRQGRTATGKSTGRGSFQPNPRALPVSLRLKVVQEVLERGAPAQDVSRVFGVAVSTIKTWCRLFEEGGPEALVPKPIVPPVRERKADPTRDAVAALKEEHPEFGTRRISDVLRRFEAL